MFSIERFFITIFNKTATINSVPIEIIINTKFVEFENNNIYSIVPIIVKILVTNILSINSTNMVKIFPNNKFINGNKDIEISISKFGKLFNKTK
jgi:hypothetical protein